MKHLQRHESVSWNCLWIKSSKRKKIRGVDMTPASFYWPTTVYKQHYYWFKERNLWRLSYLMLIWITKLVLDFVPWCPQLNLAQSQTKLFGHKRYLESNATTRAQRRRQTINQWASTYSTVIRLLYTQCAVNIRPGRFRYTASSTTVHYSESGLPLSRTSKCKYILTCKTSWMNLMRGEKMTI